MNSISEATKVVSVSELVDLTTLSQNESWGELLENVIKYKKENGIEDNDLVLDTKGTYIKSTSYQLDNFFKLLNEVKLVVYNNDELRKSYVMAALLRGVDETRVENVEILIKTESRADKKLRKSAEQMYKENCKIIDNRLFIDFDVYNQLYNCDSTDAAEYIIYEICLGKENMKLSEVIFEAHKVDINRSVVEQIIRIRNRCEQDGIKVDFDYRGNDYSDKIQNSVLLSETYFKQGTLTDDEKLTTIMKTINSDAVGMIVKYKNTKSIDRYGRKGNGEVVSSRIAIFRGIDAYNHIVIDSYNNNTFYTMEQWADEHDGEMLEELEHETLVLDINQIGFLGFFVGSDYHFIFPIQQSESENKFTIWEEDGKLKDEKLTIPERAGIVFDSWGVEYNHKLLKMCIEATKEHLNGKDVDIASLLGVSNVE